MTNRYDDMNAQEIAEDVLETAYNPSQVDTAFESLKALDTETRKDVVNIIEKELTQEMSGMAENNAVIQYLFRRAGIQKDLVSLTEEDRDQLAKFLNGNNDAPTKKDRAEAAKEEKEGAEQYQSIGRMFQYISKIKGAEADPVTREIANQFSALPNANYSSYLDTLKMSVAFAEGYKKGKELSQKPGPAKSNKPHKPKGFNS